MNKARPLQKKRPGFFSAGARERAAGAGETVRHGGGQRNGTQGGSGVRRLPVGTGRKRRITDGPTQGGGGPPVSCLPSRERGSRRPPAAGERRPRTSPVAGGRGPPTTARHRAGSAPGHPARRWVKETSDNPARRRANLPFLAFRKKFEFFQKTVDKPLCRW